MDKTTKEPVILSDKELARRGQRLLLTGLAVLAVAAVLALGLTTYSNVAVPGSGALTISAPAGGSRGPTASRSGNGPGVGETPAPTETETGEASNAAPGRVVRLTPGFARGSSEQPAPRPSGKSPLPEGKSFDW